MGVGLDIAQRQDGHIHPGKWWQYLDRHALALPGMMLPGVKHVCGLDRMKTVGLDKEKLLVKVPNQLGQNLGELPWNLTKLIGLEREIRAP